MNRTTYSFFRLFIRAILRLIARVEIVGFQNIPVGGFVIAANHIGRLDATLPYFVLDRSDIVMVVAEKYEQYAIFRWLVRLTNGMFVDRYHADIHAIRETLRRLQQGQVFTITPEGTRSKSGNLIQGRPGGVYLAWKAGVPILPVALTGSEDAVVVKRLKQFKRLNIKIVAGQPFTLPQVIKANQRDQVLQHYTDEIMCRIAALLPPERRGVYSQHPRLQELLEEHESKEQSNLT
jgi:1-acyl-sn-glycerol-3-phosphate acyltransferase